MSGKRLLFVALGLFLVVVLGIYLMLVLAESYHLNAGSGSRLQRVAGVASEMTYQLEGWFFGGHTNPYDNSIASRVIYKTKQPDIVQVSNSCTEEECLTQKTSGELYGTGRISGYHVAVERAKSSTGETVSCDGFVVIDGSENLKKYFADQFAKKSPFLSKTNEGWYIMNLPTDALEENEKKLVTESTVQKQVVLTVLKTEKSLVRAEGCFSPFVILRTTKTPPYGESHPSPTYPITDGKTYRILAGATLDCEGSDEPQHDEILEIKVSGKWLEVYRPEERTDGRCFGNTSISEESIQVSPRSDYVLFTLIGWEWSEEMLVNNKTRKSIFPEDTHTKGLIWSTTGMNYSYVSQSEQFGGTGEDAIFVSTFNAPDTPKRAFSLSDWAGSIEAAWSDYELKNLQFLDNQTIQFSVFRLDNGQSTDDELARYKYDLKSGKLTEVFRR